MILALLKAGFGFTVMALAIPFWIASAERARSRRRAGPAVGDAAPRVPDDAMAWVRPARETLAWLTAPPADAVARVPSFAPMLALAAAILPLAVIPFGGHHTIGAAAFSLSVADFDWSGLAWFVPALLAPIAVLGAAAVSRDREAALREALAPLAPTLGLALAASGVFVFAGTADLQAIAHAQDATMRPFPGLAEALGTPLPGGLAGVALPAWGLLSQPLAFLAFVAFAARRARSLTPAAFDAGAFRWPAAIEVAVTAALGVTLFLGAWALPYAPAASLVELVSPWFGAGVARGATALIQVATFLGKLVAVIALWLALRRLADERAGAAGRGVFRGRGLRGWMLVAGVNLLATALLAPALSETG